MREADAVLIEVPSSLDARCQPAALADAPTYCPGAQPEMDGAVAFGVIGAVASEPLVSYLSALQPAGELLCLSGPRRATEVFRFGAPCVESGCQHFGAGTCQLAERLSASLPTAVQQLPPCRLRPVCRWWREQGENACLRCPGVLGTHYEPS